MNQSTTNFYFTLPDPDYSVKGSRDPLGFQVIWQQQAKKLIPYLSTVSGNLRDFQVFSLAYYLYGKEADRGFVPFFLKFEQLMAYARFQNGEGDFNGTRKVAGIMREAKTLSLSLSKKDQILTNQRAYGIWGKYNRPYQDIGFLKLPDFQPIYSSKIEKLKNREAFLSLIQKLLDKDSVRINVEDLGIVNGVFKYTVAEMSLYENNLLLVNKPDHLQNELYRFLKSHEADGFSYPLLYAFRKYGKNNTLLAEVLDETIATEKILCPLNRIFRYVQTKPIWTRDVIERDAFIKQCANKPVKHVFQQTSEHNKNKNMLSLLLELSNWELVKKLVERNKQVTEEREGAAWMSINGDIIEVHHPEGHMYDPEFDPDNNFDNDYFYNTYIRLFKQLIPT